MDNIKCDVTHVNKEKVEYVQNKMNDEQSVITTANLFKSLGNDTRLKIVDVLIQSEMCVCDIAVVLDMTQSSISHQLSKMKKDGVVVSRREGPMIYYSIKDDHIKDIYLNALSHCVNC